MKEKKEEAKGCIKKGTCWYAIIDLPREGGKRVQKWVRLGKMSATAAGKARGDLIREQDDGILVLPTKLTLAQLLEAWLNHQVTEVRPKTLEGYKYLVHKHIIPALGNVKMTDLKPYQIKDGFYKEKLTSGRCDGKGGLSGCSVRAIHQALHATLKWAKEQGLIKFNPMDAVKAPKVEHTDIKIATREGIINLLNKSWNTEYFEIFWLAIYDALRRSEILGLRWGDIDFIEGKIFVKRSLHSLEGGIVDIQATKTHRSKRAVDIGPDTYMVLHRLYDKQKALYGSLRKAEVTEEEMAKEYVFSRQDKHGNPVPYLPNSVTHAWIKMARSVGLDGVRLHDARHTNASIKLNDGTPLSVVQEGHGHERGSTTQNIYAHVVGDAGRKAAVRYEEIIRFPLAKMLENC